MRRFLSSLLVACTAFGAATLPVGAVEAPKAKSHTLAVSIYAGWMPWYYAKEAGIISLHTAMTQRRYEQFDSLAAFQENFDRCKKTVALAEPVLRKYRMPLGIENHKGWRAAEQAAWIKSTGSEWIGVHFDFGQPIPSRRLLGPPQVCPEISLGRAPRARS